MQYKTIKKNEMKIIGLKIVTTNENYQSVKDQKDLWERFFKENIGDRIPNKLNAGEVLGVYTDYESDYRGKYSFVVGYEVANFNNLPKDMVGLTIPSAKYASFNNDEQIRAAMGVLRRKNIIIKKYQSNKKKRSEKNKIDSRFFS